MRITQIAKTSFGCTGLAMLAACATATPQAAQRPAVTAQATPQRASDGPAYAAPESWLCLPGRADACAANLDTAVIDADGTVTVERFERAAEPSVDCFYVYPTVSLDPSANSDMNAGPEENSVAVAQFARFGAHCRTFAPLYRQVTVSALRAARPDSSGTPIAALPEGSRDVAYGDVRRAWEEYLAKHNGGRGVILIGHSQGTGILKRLIAEEIEHSPAKAQIVSAFLIGFNVEVPEGESVGAEFDEMPLCTAQDETGCIVAYSSFRPDMPPSAKSLFGRSYRPGIDIACVNPAAPGSEAVAPLDAYFTNNPDGSQQKAWLDGTAITQRFVKLKGAVTGQCTHKDGASFLAVTIDASAPRHAPAFGPLADNPMMAGVWGLHMVDVHVAIGDMVEMAGRQANAWLAERVR